MEYFNGKVAAITGAASGIGKTLAVELAARKCHLALSDIDQAGLDRAKEELSIYGVKITTQRVDVANEKQVHGWADNVVKEHGKVNFIFNNAGVAMGGSVECSSYADYEWILGINLWGVIYGTKAFLPYIKETKNGHIINISSVFGIFSQPTQSGYNMSKFAVRGFTESLRQELDILKSGVSATCVHPGGIKTNIAQNARMLDSMSSFTGGDNIDSMKEKFESLFLTTPKKAAKKILTSVIDNKRRVLVGPDAYVLDIMQRGLPVSYQKLVTASFSFASR